MNRFAHDVVAAERERQVADAAAEVHARARGLDLPARLDEVDGVLVVLFESCRDRQDVRVEDDVGRIEVEAFGEQRVGPLADLELARDRVGLAGLVEGHHDDARAELLNAARFLQEIVFAFLEADRIDDRLPLHALQSGLEHRPLRAVDHDRHARDLGLGGDEVQEMRHRLLRVEQAFVHVDVDQVRAAAHLIERDVDRLAELAVLDQPLKFLRAGHVGALADHLEVAVGPDRQHFEARELACAAT